MADDSGQGVNVSCVSLKLGQGLGCVARYCVCAPTIPPKMKGRPDEIQSSSHDSCCLGLHDVCLASLGTVCQGGGRHQVPPERAVPDRPAPRTPCRPCRPWRARRCGRRRRRGVAMGEKGVEFLIDLAETPTLRHGDAFELEDGRLVLIATAPASSSPPRPTRPIPSSPAPSTTRPPRFAPPVARRCR